VPTLRVVVTLYSLLLFCLGPRPAAGHAFPEHAKPRVGATIAVSPARVRIWFDGLLEPAFSSIRVQTVSGKQIDRGNGRVNPNDLTLLEVDLPPLSSGIYRVTWSVVARDGHHTEGDYTFTVQQGH
jgi:methionine-rich copper-binding protein CopC